MAASTLFFISSRTVYSCTPMRRSFRGARDSGLGARAGAQAPSAVAPAAFTKSRRSIIVVSLVPVLALMWIEHLTRAGPRAPMETPALREQREGDGGAERAEQFSSVHGRPEESARHGQSARAAGPVA